MCVWDVQKVPVGDGAITAVHGALGGERGGHEAVRAAATGMVRGGERGQDTGSSCGSRVGWDEAVVTPLKSRSGQDWVGQDACQQALGLKRAKRH